jgi:hypothetical protein
LNVRTSPAIASDNIYTQVKQGEALKRTGYSENWFRIVIEDKEYYISANAQYTSPDDPNAEIEFSVRYETVYVTAESLYIRETPHSAGAIYSTLTKGQELLRIGAGIAKALGHVDHQEVQLLSVLLIGLLKMGHLRLARAAPACPEIQHYALAPEVGELHLVPIRIRHGEIGGEVLGHGLRGDRLAQIDVLSEAAVQQHAAADDDDQHQHGDDQVIGRSIHYVSSL